MTVETIPGDPLKPSLSGSDIAKLAQRNSTRWIADLAADWIAILGFFVAFDLLGHPWILAPIFSLGIGTRQHALALLGHDGTHRLAFRNRWWNDRLTEWLAGWVLGATLDGGYRDWHFLHHRTLGTQADPELAYRGRNSSYATPVTRSRIWLRFTLDVLGFGVTGLGAFLREILPRSPIRFAPPVLFYSGLFVGTWWIGEVWIFALWSYSVVAGFWSVFRMRTWLEHVGLEASGRFGSHRISANWLERFLFFPHNTWCHYEHHLYPQVPYFNLPELRKKLMDIEGQAHRHVFPFREVLVRFHDLDGTLKSTALTVTGIRRSDVIH